MSAAESSVVASRALDQLYRSHATEVYRYAYAVLGNHADAEDVTQTTFVNALRALERGERPRKPSNWLITITHNIIRQRFRQQQARPSEVVLDRDIAQEAADESGPSMEELVRALQRIPQSQREALVMRELEGRSYKEIAQILDLSMSALETLLFRARRSLADELENLVTCDRAELGLSKLLDERLSRKERKRLDDHIAECPSCARLQATQGKQRRAFNVLALLPLPLSLTLFKGVPSASAAIGLPTIGAVGTAAAVGGGAAASGGGLSLGGLVLGGVAVKAAAVITAVTVAGGVGYVGTKEVQSHRNPKQNTPVTAVSPTSAKPRPATAGGAGRSAAETSKGKALANGSARATAPTGSRSGTTAPGRRESAPGLALKPRREPKRSVTQAPKRPVTATTRRPAKPAGRPAQSIRTPETDAKPAVTPAKAGAPVRRATTVEPKRILPAKKPASALEKPKASATLGSAPEVVPRPGPAAQGPGDKKNGNSAKAE